MLAEGVPRGTYLFLHFLLISKPCLQPQKWEGAIVHGLRQTEALVAVTAAGAMQAKLSLGE
ncbi:hypothetical protein CFL01nite_02060 [Corynebacterium flavescens]|uniref:Uncharacterized protein n=1 Tax=Corynebacterium flavescens TaxID=28028 RepID=A0A1L7CL56_CORFL|nr:hypothetical protein CFLV_04655 [Corynebacterium flavescens]GEB96711.1 hypothetical protein CFL01nite_02060 [Corynebacterium flavescens]HCG47201.1 hypothetical protein [Corynebacterium flavescens]